MTNILVTAMLLTGGSAVVTSLTGMHTVAGCFLLPLGVIVYTLFGGIKATFLTDYVHTVVILVIIFIFAFKTYATSEILGSPGRVYDLLMEASARHPVDGNAHGSYLTMRSKEGIIFFVINIVGNFGTVFCDNGYYNKAIAAHPVSALPGYIMGGLSWFAIPWLCATTMGLAALATESFPSFPTYPARMPSEDVTAGLVLPYAAVALLGSGGAIATLILIFMAVTSATSAAADPALEAAADEERRRLLRASTIAKWITASMALSFLVLWPMPLFGSAYVFSKKFFTGWVVVGIVWLACSTACVGIFPLCQGRKAMARTSVMLFRDVFGLKRRGGPVVAGVEPAAPQQATHRMAE